MNDRTHIAIIGLGLMGGSLAMALKARGHRGRVAAASRREAARRAAVAAGAVDAAFERPEEAVAGAEIIVLCAPVMIIPRLAASVGPAADRTAIVTDVGSTKRWVLDHARAALGDEGPVLVGSHPIAGSERQGFDAARPDLYDGAVTVVTPDGAPAAAVAAVEAMWSSVGSRVVRLPAEVHDRHLARSSHLPHMTAAMLAWCAGREDGVAANVSELCGPGFRDTTRIAAGAPEIWHDIAMTNRDALLEELACLAGAIDRLRRHLEDRDSDAVLQFLEEARQARQRLLQRTSPAAASADS